MEETLIQRGMELAFIEPLIYARLIASGLFPIPLPSPTPIGVLFNFLTSVNVITIHPCVQTKSLELPFTLPFFHPAHSSHPQMLSILLAD